MERKLQNFYTCISSLKHIILHWEKIINSETRFLQRFIMINIDILCPLESHAFEIIPVTLSLVKHAYKEVPGKGDFTS